MSLSEESFHKQELTPLLHATSIEQYLQKIYLMKYLQKFYDHETCIDKFSDICRFTDIEKKLYKNENEKIYDMAIKQNWPKNSVRTSFYVTQKEINFINTIDAPREFRMFILGILIYGKHAKQQTGIPMCNIRDRSYIYYLVTHKDEFNVGRRRSTYLNKLLADRENTHHGIKFYPAAATLRNSVCDVPKTVIAFNADWIEWDAPSGYLISNMEEDPRKISDLIQDWTKKCPRCGNTYFVSKKAKTDLCPSCYNFQRQQYKILHEKNRRKKNKRGQEQHK